MNWNNFIWFAIPSVVLWLAAGVTVYKPKKRMANILMLSGIALFTTFIIGFWIHIERPPMRTMGETRLWYSFFLSVVGYLAYRRWKYPWLLSFSALVASVFVFV
ncbi:cytochrome C assembly protein, partial [Bacteroides sp. OttesenSCG-928-M17]|nr:cytochrome C assembly protein [Bacteroides sp. OttesenSCG-928-M17]